MTLILPYDGQPGVGGADPWGATLRAALLSLQGQVTTQTGYNIIDYGADPTGVNDSSGPIQDAIADAVSHGGGVITVPAGGDFVVDGPVSWKDKVSCRGYGQDVSRIRQRDGRNDWVISFDDTQETRGIFFEDLTIDGGLQPANGGGILANGAVECRFSRVHFTSCYNWGLELGPTADTGSGPGFGHNNLVLGCWFDSGDRSTVVHGSSSTGYGGGIHTTSNDENWVAFCDFVYLGGSGGHIVDGDFVVSDYPSCIFDQSGLICVYCCNFVGGSHYVAGVYSKDMTAARIIGCNFDGVHGTNVFANGFGHIITNNYFSGPGHENTGVSVDHQVNGIELGYGSSHCTVANNTLIADDGSAGGNTYTLIRETGDGDSGSNTFMANTLVAFDRGATKSPRGGGTLGPAYDLGGGGLGGTTIVLGNVGIPDRGATNIPTVYFYGPDENDVSPGRTWTTEVKPTTDVYTALPYFGNGTTIMSNFTFVKQNNSTSIEVSIEASGKATATTTTDQFGVIAGVRITNAVSLAGDSYDVAEGFFVGDSQTRSFSGRKMVNSLPAGSYKGAVYIAMGTKSDGSPAAGATFTMDTGSTLYLRMEEVQL